MTDKENSFEKDINVPSKKNKQIEELQEQLARKTQLSIEQSKELIRLRQELKESTVKNKNLRQECERSRKRI